MSTTDRIQVLLRASKLKYVEYQPRFLLKNESVRELRELNYFEQWQKSSTENLFNIKLFDHSLVVFQESDEGLSYNYLQSPIAAPSFEEFLNIKGVENTAKNRQEHQEDFDLAIISSEEKKHITPIRYDYDKNGYNPGSHPAGHIHIGIDNQIRIGFNKIMNKASFLLFIIRQAYPDNWRNLLLHQEAKNITRYLRSECQNLESRHWQEADQYEHHLT